MKKFLSIAAVLLISFYSKANNPIEKYLNFAKSNELISVSDSFAINILTRNSQGISSIINEIDNQFKAIFNKDLSQDMFKLFILEKLLVIKLLELFGFRDFNQVNPKEVEDLVHKINDPLYKGIFISSCFEKLKKRAKSKGVTTNISNISETIKNLSYNDIDSVEIIKQAIREYDNHLSEINNFKNPIEKVQEIFKILDLLDYKKYNFLESICLKISNKNSNDTAKVNIQ